MKTLISPGIVRVSGTPSRSYGRRSPAGRPPCFFQIWRDCTNDDGYLVFTDGSVYHYDTSAASVMQIITAALKHGTDFNAFFRRSLLSGGGYERFIGIFPSTAVMIYQNPPYPGVDPGVCPPCTPGFIYSSLVGCYQPVPNSALNYDGMNSVCSGQVVINGPTPNEFTVDIVASPANSAGPPFYYGAPGTFNGVIMRDGVVVAWPYFPAGAGAFQYIATEPLVACTPVTYTWFFSTVGGLIPPLDFASPVSVS